MVEIQVSSLADSGKQPQAKQTPETYKKVKLLGKGSFGKAFLVKCGSDGVSNFIIRIEGHPNIGVLPRSLITLSLRKVEQIE